MPCFGPSKARIFMIIMMVTARSTSSMVVNGKIFRIVNVNKLSVYIRCIIENIASEFEQLRTFLS